MKKIAALTSSLLVAACALFAGEANAQATRTWVSGVGDDVNPCSRTAPCKTFAGAISKTAANGVINCLDGGGFGAVTITKSLTIDCYWQSAAGVLAPGTTGVIVNAAATDKVVLRGLEIDGMAQGVDGVRVVNAGAVQIDHCRIAGFTTSTASGIRVTVANTPFQLHVKDTHVLNNGTGTTGGGIVIAPTGSVDMRVVLSRVEMRDNSNGLDVTGAGASSGSAQVSAMDVVSSGNRNVGVRSTGGGAAVSILLDRSMVTGNLSHGVIASGANANAVVGRTTVVGNGAGFSVSGGGNIYSYGTNQVNGNGTDGAPTGGFMEK